MEGHGRSWKLVECSVSVTLYDLEMSRTSGNPSFSLVTCISSYIRAHRPHTWKNNVNYLGYSHKG